MSLGIILGSSLLTSEAFNDFTTQICETEFGKVQYSQGQINSVSVVIIRRHLFDTSRDYTMPSEINYKAMISAFKMLGCTKIIAFYSVGSLKESIPLGSVVIPDDYAYLGAPLHIYHDNAAHFVPCLDEDMRSCVAAILEKEGFAPIKEGTYFQTFGPRFETKAEIRMYKAFFDFVGMTGSQEATLAQEQGMGLCMVGIVDNMCHGLGEPLTIEGFHQLQKSNKTKMEKIVSSVIQHICNEWNLRIYLVCSVFAFYSLK